MARPTGEGEAAVRGEDGSELVEDWMSVMSGSTDGPPLWSPTSAALEADRDEPRLFSLIIFSYFSLTPPLSLTTTKVAVRP